MNFSLLDYLFWAAAFLGHVALFLILLLRGRWRQFPIFTGYMAFEFSSNVALYEIYRHGAASLYDKAYWIFFFLDFAFQLGLMFEITRVVLKPTGSWVRDAKWIFISLGAVSVSLAIFLTSILNPPSPYFSIRWEFRFQFFESLLICELFLMVMMASKHLGLVWRNHVMGLGQGLSGWSLGSLLADAVNCISPISYSTFLERAKIVFYLAALSYWIITFWRQEPQRRELTPEMRAYLASLHRDVQDDLSKVITRNLR